ncbi:hypothetical protein [Candidatus Nitrosocosmicus oleophilus]|nr:hypothetical protein [Candidatus Nitrosocosmicus oleophilus]
MLPKFGSGGRANTTGALKAKHIKTDAKAISLLAFIRIKTLF